MTKSRIATPGAPNAVGPYSQGIDTGDIVYCSGQVGLDPATGELVAGGLAAQTRRALQNLGAVLAAAGLGYGDVVKTSCFLVDIGDFAAFNEVYSGFFPDPPAGALDIRGRGPAQGRPGRDRGGRATASGVRRRAV